MTIKPASLMTIAELESFAAISTWACQSTMCAPTSKVSICHEVMYHKNHISLCPHYLCSIALTDKAIARPEIFLIMLKLHTSFTAISFGPCSAPNLHCNTKRARDKNFKYNNIMLLIKSTSKYILRCTQESKPFHRK